MATVRGAAALVALLWLSLAAGAAPTGPESRWKDPDQHFFQPLLGDLPSELELAQRDGKKGVLLVFEMESCPFCVWLHRTALREVSVQDYYRDRFSLFRIDTRGSATIRGFDGQEASESAFATRQKVRGTPTSVFYGLDGREIARFTGAPRDRQEYLLLGEYVAEGHYRKMTFPEFRRSRTGS